MEGISSNLLYGGGFRGFFPMQRDQVQDAADEQEDDSGKGAGDDEEDAGGTVIRIVEDLGLPDGSEDGRGEAGDEEGETEGREEKEDGIIPASRPDGNRQNEIDNADGDRAGAVDDAEDVPDGEEDARGAFHGFSVEIIASSPKSAFFFLRFGKIESKTDRKSSHFGFLCARNGP